jgi:hypothetical protein
MLKISKLAIQKYKESGQIEDENREKENLPGEEVRKDDNTFKNLLEYFES